MRVLITGARLPASLELARAFASRGADVVTADTVHFGFAVSSSAVREYVRVPSPVIDFEGFRAAILRTVADFKIDLVIPVSEEVFFLSRMANEIPLFAPPFEILRALHSKIDFQKHVSPTPPTRLAASRTELDQAVREYGDVVVKQEFSRGAIGTLVKPKLFDSIRFPTLVQKFIPGPELCSYSIARNGKLLAHATYEPRYRYGYGASVYFRSLESAPVVNFVKDFVARLNFTGQIAFDFIQTSSGLVALECNPRSTSGVHLLTSEQIVNAMTGPLGDLTIAPAGVSRSAKLTLLLTNVVSPRDLFEAKDTSFSWSDPIPFLSQFGSAAELMYRSWKWKMKAGDAFGYDLEWNGEPFE